MIAVVQCIFQQKFMIFKKGIVSGILLAIVACVRFCTCSSKQIKCLNVNKFEEQLITTNNEQLIDVCTQKEFERFHISGARNIDFRSPDFRSEIEKLDKTKPILVYCLSGVRSKLTALICKKVGFEGIYELDSGLTGWLEAGKPVESEEL